MRTSLIVSAFLHLMLLAVVLININSSRKAVPSRPVAVEILSPSDLSRAKAGMPDKTEASAAPKALPEDKTADASATAPEPKVVEQPAKKQLALPPPPKPKPAPVAPPAKKAERPEKAPEKPEKVEMTAQEKADAALEPPGEMPKPKTKPVPVKSKPNPKTEPKHPPSQPDRIAGLLNQPPAENRDWRAAHEDNQRTEKAEKFDPNRISALINRDPTAGQQPAEEGPRQPWRKPSSLQEQATGMTPGTTSHTAYGTPTGRDDRMSANEIDAFIAQIARCWTPPVGGLGGEAIVVKLHIELNEDGTLARPPQVANSQSSPFFTPAADSAVRAVLQCQPYRMPVKKYGMWRDMILNFDPRQMYGG